ncbi:MAG: hypothetical protein V1736_13570 [Pseudomonadota bacterium]
MDTIDIRKYFHLRQDCDKCGFSCNEVINSIITRKRKPAECAALSESEATALDTVLKAESILPEVPLLTHPRPGTIGLVEINNPTPVSPVLLSGNNEYTQLVLMELFSTTSASFYLLFTDTHGNTVDMAIIYNTFDPKRIRKALEEACMENRVINKELIIPGVAAGMAEEIRESTGWNIRVGPICGAELPLFFSNIWFPPQK